MNESAATPGARLKAERERRGLSTQKAANELHLDPWVIEALEAGDYARIGPTVYAKGHLRKYAAMLTLPADELLADFDTNSKMPPAGQMPLGSPLDTPTNHIVSPAQMLGGLGFLVLLAGVLWWKPWQQRDTAFTVPPASPATHAAPLAEGAESPAPREIAEAEAPVREAPARVAPVREVPARAIPTLARSAPGPSAAGAGAGANALTAQANEPGAGRARLRLSFTADSWVDVRDAQGNKAYVGNGSANTVKTIAGQAPMHVYLRSGSGVQLEINGRVVAIGPQFFSGDVARFVAGADGVLRRDVHRDVEHGEPPSSTRPPG